MAIIEKMKKCKCWQDVEKLESWSTVGTNVKQYGHYGKQHGASLRNEKIEKTTTWSSSSTFGYLFKRTGNRILTRYETERQTMEKVNESNPQDPSY